MKRRVFLSRSVIAATGFIIEGQLPEVRQGIFSVVEEKPVAKNLYDLFRNPGLNYNPFVRWWWNGNKVEARELVRELRLLKDAGIGGVEINPVGFPTRSPGDDLGKESLGWLSDEWIDMLQVVFREAKELGLTCDLIVGSGWPYGSEELPGDERAEIVVIAVKKLTGPLKYEISEYEIFREADPAVSSPFPGRTMELLSLRVVPDPLSDINQVIDLSDQVGNKSFIINIPSGNYALYGLVRIKGFMEVINGVPGATGPVLDHFNAAATGKYLDRMSDAIEKRCGPLSGNIRALFTDSMELEGSNWYPGIMEEFTKRRGYNLFPFLPFVLFRTGAMGNVTDFNYGVKMSAAFEDTIQRMRYDFELTKAELMEERFLSAFTAWCRRLGVKSRAQAYGRNLFPLESSFSIDIPECESWTTNWLKHKVGEEMPEDDYRRGRAYTMINKYVSSAANLTGKRIVSCEEMTDTYTVFNTTLENLKIGGDQSAMTGVTHSVFHGFNYSPPEAPYPGWIRYGCYYNENNTWWPWFRYYNEYKARMSAVLQNVTMHADIAVLPPLSDMWSILGAQMEPFPSVTHIDYMTLVWEAINKNGNGCDYVSERVICGSEVKEGQLCFGPRKYHTLFIIGVDSIDPVTATRLSEFVSGGGRIFCVDKIPHKSTGYRNSKENDKLVSERIEIMRSYPERFILLKRPEKDFIAWYRSVQEKYGIRPFMRSDNPSPYVMQNLYTAGDGTKMIYIVNSHINNNHQALITFSEEITKGRFCWVWDPESGERYRVFTDRDNSLSIDLSPAGSVLFVFDTKKNGPQWNPVPAGSPEQIGITDGWSAELNHCQEGKKSQVNFGELKDLKDIPGLEHFAGEIIYRNNFDAGGRKIRFINLGKVHGVSELTVNGTLCGAKWYGRRIWNVEGIVTEGKNMIEIRIATPMGNYMKSLTGNPVAQYWTNEKNKIQPLHSMGLIGPVTLY